MLQRMKAWWTTFRFRHVLLEVLVSLSLAFLVWLYTHSRARESTDYLQVPVQVQLAPAQRDGYLLETGGENRVNVSFTGPTSRIREVRRKLQRGTLQVSATVSVPEDKLTDGTYCDVVRINEEHLPVPVGVTAELAEETRAIPITVHRLTERMLPVKLDATGEVRVAQVKVEPATVLVRGPKSVLDRAAFVSTQPCALQPNPDDGDGKDPVVRDQVALVTELDGRPVQTNPRAVNFRCRVFPKQKVYDLHDIPVHFLSPAGFPYRPRFLHERPNKISVKLVGPTSEVPPPVFAFVDLTAGSFARGRNLEPVRVQLPKDFQLLQTTTPVVAFYLDELDRTTATTTSRKGGDE